MLSRAPLHPMPLADRPDWDIFCIVIDNFGDIGVCWRLTRQLADEHKLRVRLWVDDLCAFQSICPEIDPKVADQLVFGVEIRRWDAAFPELIPGQVVVEAFACRIPEAFETAMAQRQPKSVWINLEYLSAECWVAGCHALPSPHPRLALTKYFFFPGFTPDTGGLLREHDLLARRQDFAASPELREAFWLDTGFPASRPDALHVSLFSYENPTLAQLLHLWETSVTPVCCLLPVSRTLPAVEAFCKKTLTAGDIVLRGALEIRVLPFVEQRRYDEILWLCDLNFVRGEDSFVRAQWAAKPMVWHIYPQEENAHLGKLDAFLDLYCAGLPEAMAGSLRAFWHGWNVGQMPPELWRNFLDNLPRLREHAALWATRLAEQEDLSSALVRFCRTKL